MLVRPTELGVKGGLLLAALGLAFFAAAYSNLFFLIIAFCCVLGALGLWWTVRNLRGVTIRVLEAEPAAAGSERQLLLAITGRGDRTACDLTFEIAPGERKGSGCELLHLPMLRGEVRHSATLLPQDRGLRRVTAVRCSSRFPFGLFRASLMLPVDFELVTYPRPLANDPRARTLLGGSDNARSAAVAGLRPFRGGDNLGDVHWKASARRGKPIVKERERGGGDAMVEIVVDRRRDDAAEFEADLARAMTMLSQAIAAERPVHLRSQGFTLTVDAGQTANPLLRWLAAAEPLPAAAPAPDTRRREVLHV